MAAIRRGKKKTHLQKKKSKRQRRPKKQVPGQRKFPANYKKNICVIRLPKTSYLRTCPLISWYFNRRIRNSVFSFKKLRGIERFYGGYPTTYKGSFQAAKERKNPRAGCTCPEILKAVLKEVASKKRAKWVVDRVKKRPRYSDDEIFYRLANPPEDAGGAADAETQRPSMLSQPTNEPQSVSS